MQNKKHILVAVFIFLIAFLSSGTQDAQAQVEEPEDTIIETKTVVKPIGNDYDPLRPAKAAFYGAVLPGLGQAYNKDYWKLPIVYGAMGTGVYFAVENNNEFQRYRTAFKERLAGRVDEFTIIDPETGELREVFTDDALIDAQDFFRRRKELSILITAGLYVLQIIEANVDAHLSQYDVSDDITFAPDMQPDDLGMAMSYGFKLTYQLD
ncbi:hypothetical protein EAX61_00955 [Dokdonia sinensis]|uniref:DUF5683 domain-containing protein n=1 Tax=Dokdonia sinensis TaxID=2479847 RepID=A0A3M0GFW7_9FLAO|nr:DUF5683 domain-containing protein [Dokdonia sinensis]RMB63981.1 hypothetical protein EAX61_00955 [Dokdonia sinensis]